MYSLRRPSIRLATSSRRWYSAQEDWLHQFEALHLNNDTASVAFVKDAVQSGIFRNGVDVREALVNSQTGTKSAMRLRDCVTALNRKDKDNSSGLKDDYKTLNAQLKNYLSVAFSSDTLQFSRVTFHGSSGTLLEKVAEQDSVLHRVRTLRDLKKRLGEGRRCFALQHPSLPNDPIAFIHVALTPELAPSLSYLDATCSGDLHTPTHAMFYSVNAPHSALSGLDLATRIIKLAVGAVQAEFPSVHTFSTLSPVPSFLGWLQSAHGAPFPIDEERALLTLAESRGHASWQLGSDNGKAALSFLATALSDHDWYTDRVLREALRSPLQWLGTYYLASEKQGCGTVGLPYDPVARFHLRNGASMHRVNVHGNTTPGGLSKSAGLMCNYMYSLPHLRERHEKFVGSSPPGEFHRSAAVTDTLLK